MLYDIQLSTEEIAEVSQNLEEIQDKANCFLKAVQKNDGKLQLDLFMVNDNNFTAIPLLAATACNDLRASSFNHSQRGG